MIRNAGSGAWPVRKALGKGGNENDRDFLSSQNLVDRIEPGAAIGKLDVGQNKARPALERRAHRLGMGPRDRRDVVTQLLDKRLNVERDERFILDDQTPSCEFVRRFRGPRDR